VVRGLGARALVVADPFLATTDAFAQLHLALTEAGVDTRVVTDVPPELPVGAVQNAAESVREFGADVILGYGGGSALDAAKLIALLLRHGGHLSDYYGENAVPGPIAPLVAVPTTAGTGSEVTPVAVVSDPGSELKVGVSSPFLIPVAAFVDPELTLAAPGGVTAHAGIDAFVHAVESFTAAPLALDPAAPQPVFTGRNALTAPLSVEAAGVIFRNLGTVVDDPTNRGAREAMAYGSLLAGMAFGPTGTHLSHAIQYPIGAMTKTPHGLGTGALLPYVLQATLPAVGPQLTVLGGAMGVVASGTVDPDAPQQVVDAIAELCASIGLPVALSELGLSDVDADRIVELTLRVGRLVSISPVPADRPFLARIVRAAIAGDRSALAASDRRRAS
jgi:alcohol dehydrogenase